MTHLINLITTKDTQMELRMGWTKLMSNTYTISIVEIQQSVLDVILLPSIISIQIVVIK